MTAGPPRNGCWIERKNATKRAVLLLGVWWALAFSYFFRLAFRNISLRDSFLVTILVIGISYRGGRSIDLANGFCRSSLS